MRVKGLVQVFQNRPQLTIHKIQPVADSEVESSDYFPVSKRDRMEMFRELEGWIAGMGNPHLKALLRIRVRRSENRAGLPHRAGRQRACIITGSAA